MPVSRFERFVVGMDAVVGAAMRPAARRVLWATGKTPHVLGTRLWLAGWVCYWIGEAASTLVGLVRLAGNVSTPTLAVMVVLEAALFLLVLALWNVPVLAGLGKDLTAVRSVANGRLLVDPALVIKLVRSGMVLVLAVHLMFDHVGSAQLVFDTATRLSISLGLYMIYEKKPPTTLRSTAKAKLAAARARLADIQWAPTPAPSPI